MKERAADESLSEEARESARKALEVLVASELLDIEQTAEVKQLQSEQNAALQKKELEAQFVRRQAEAAQKKAKAEALLLYP